MDLKDKKIQSGALGVLFLAVFIDLLEFGIVVPLLPFWTTNLGATPFIYGVLASAYSFMSFAFAPIWGKLSDRRGRRPVILSGLVGTVIGLSLLVLSAVIFTESLMLLFLSRIVGGMFTAATLPTSQAYIADTTTGKDRAKGFGLIGAAFGLGFALGPGIGGILSLFGGYAAPVLFATILAIINLAAAIKFLPESLTKEVRDQRTAFRDSIKETAEIGLVKTIGSNPLILLLILVFAGISLAFSGMQATLALLGAARFGLNESLTGVIFFVVGIISVITQGGVIRPLSNRLPDSILIAVGLFFMTIAFIGLSTVTSLLEMTIWIAPLAFGSSIANPTLGALLSKKAPKEKSGALLGLNQGVGSFMRIGGPLAATALFEIDVAFPYYLGAIILAIGFIFGLALITLARERIPEIEGLPCLNCGNKLQEGIAICGRCGTMREMEKLVKEIDSRV
ncbi:MAG: MFS transporter [Candidatus Hermodarchaeota archaeon]